MTEDDSSTSPGPLRQPSKKFQPATWMAGRRRRYANRHERIVSGGIPRSATTPVLYSGVGMAGGMAMSPAYVAFAQPEAAPPTRAKSTSTSTSLVPTNSNGSPDVRPEWRKKRNILEAIKLKERSHEPVVTSPLPLKPLTPKAAKVLGLKFMESNDGAEEIKSGDTTNNKKERRSEDTTDSEEDIVQVRPKIQRKSSLQWLNSHKFTVEEDTEFRADDIDEFGMPITTSTQGFLKKIDWKGSGRKAKYMLDLVQPKAMGTKQSPVPTTPSRSSKEDRHDNDIGYSSDSDIYAPRRVAPRLISVQKRRSRIHKKRPKSLERMSPITEASLSEDGFIIQGDRDSTMLEAISEDGQPTYTLEEDDLSLDEDEQPTYASDSDQFSSSEEEQSDNKKELEDNTLTSELPHRDTMKLRRIEHPGTIHIKSPLQELESTYLDNMEMKKNMDFKKEQLYQSQMSMKRELRDIKAHTLFRGVRCDKSFYGPLVDGVYDHHSEEESNGHVCSDNEDLTSRKEPEILKAPYLTFTRVTPGMVKLVDIPPRKSDTIFSQDEESYGGVKASVSHKRSGAVLIGRVSVCGLFEQYKDIDSKRSNTTLARRSPDIFTDQMRVSPLRQESLGQSQGWFDDYHHAGMSSFSEPIDPKALAEQEKLSIPLPKGTPAPSLLQNRISPVPCHKHQCIHNGHIFHKYNIKHIPDNIGINDLEVRPYFQTPTGVNQDIDIPIYCQKCDFSVLDELWQCSVPVCRLAVCRHCATDMEVEWQQRSVEAWKRK
jgi:hypothetical protein